MSKKMKILFTLSLVLNVVLFGVVAGHVMRRAHDFPWNDKRFPEAVRAEMKETFADLAPLRQEIWEKKRAMGAVIAADAFDGAAYDALAAEVSALKASFEARKTAALKEVVSDLSDAERKAFVKHMEERFERRGKRWGKGRGLEK